MTYPQPPNATRTTARLPIPATRNPGCSIATRTQLHTASADRRRTIAWHIARLPGGRVALAIQYAHLRATASEGYSGRARHGLQRVLDIETARATADYLNRVNDRIEQGKSISGSAARRLIDAARDAATRFHGMFLSPRQIRGLLSDPKLQVHDNPQAFLTCCPIQSRAANGSCAGLRFAK